MLSSLATLSPWTLILGVIIIVISVLEAFFAGKKPRKERTFKILTALLAIALLFIQAASNKRSSEESQAKLDKALDKQKQQITNDLTIAFQTGTNQVVTLAGQEADKTRKAANDQTKSIQSQANQQETRLEDASLGSNTCPKIWSSQRGHQRPYDLSAFNTDKNANIYDLTVYVTEMERNIDGKSMRTLQRKMLKFPIIPANAGNADGTVPFEFLSQRNTAYLSFDLSTRRKICSGLIVLHGDGNGDWYTESYPMHEGPTTAHNTEIPDTDRPWNPAMMH
jgi:hypothetical protein